MSKEHPAVTMGDLRGRMKLVLCVKGIGDKGDADDVDAMQKTEKEYILA